MEFKKITEFGDFGLTSMFVSKIDDKIVVYGGSNFPDKTPPDGSRKVYNDIYIFDEKFNLLETKKGSIYPDRCLNISLGNKSYLISGAGNNKIFEYYFENGELVEKEIFDLGFEIIGAYGGYYNNKLYFGDEYMYEFDLKELKLVKKAKFIGNVRQQAVTFVDNACVYVFGGASNICCVDSYIYNIDKDEWEKLEDLPTSFTAAASCKIDEHKFAIVGGCNRRLYDEAVANLHLIEFKREYFSRPREKFFWNEDIYIYNTIDGTYEIRKGSIDNATCGSGLIKIGDNLYLINGEIKPGYRSTYILEGKL